jgi:hypothetical protein
MIAICATIVSDPSIFMSRSSLGLNGTLSFAFGGSLVGEGYRGDWEQVLLDRAKQTLN